MSAQHQQRRTRATNSNAHPGLVDRGAARRSHEEAMEAKRVKEDAKFEKEANEKLTRASKATRIARLEQAIDDEDNALDITPRPQSGKKKDLRRTATFLDIPSAEREYEYLDSSNMDKDDITVTDHRPKSLTAMVDQRLCSEEEDAPAKKKKKVEKPAKPSMRDQIQGARDTTHRPWEGPAATKNPSMSASRIYTSEDEIPFQVQHLKETGRPKPKPKGPKPKPKAHPERLGRHLSTIDSGEDNATGSDEDAMKINVNKKGIMVMHGVDGGLKRGRSTEASGVSAKMKGYVYVHPMMITLTLDQTTLFYLNLSNAYVQNDHSGLTDEINTWALKVPHDGNSTRKVKSKMSVPSATTPPLTSAPSSRFSRSSGPTARSALNNAIKVTGRNSNNDNEIQISQDTEYNSDQDETMGDERDSAVKSPPKSGQRISSSVRLFNDLLLSI